MPQTLYIVTNFGLVSLHGRIKSKGDPVGLDFVLSNPDLMGTSAPMALTYVERTLLLLLPPPPLPLLLL